MRLLKALSVKAFANAWLVSIFTYSKRNHLKLINTLFYNKHMKIVISFLGNILFTLFPIKMTNYS